MVIHHPPFPLLEHIDAGLMIKILSGITTGILCVSVGQPTDVVKIRLQAQGATGHKQYSGSLQAYSCIAKTEGIRGLWKGTFLPWFIGLHCSLL